jgi:excisionase family DNA binding protein
MDEARYLTAAEAAERLGISLRTVRRRIADGTLPAVRIGGSVRIPVSAIEAPPPAAPAAARETAAPYGTVESKEEYVQRWNREHWPDTYENMLRRRREAFAELEEIAKRTKPPSGPHDTVDALLRQERDAFGARLLQYIPDRRGGDS